MNISALLIARNEQAIVKNCLESLCFADEIIVILDRSIDDTESICKKYTKKVYRGSWNCEGERRNYGIKKCSFDWIFEIDADEIVSRHLQNEILKKKKLTNFDFFYIKLINYVGDKPLKYGWMGCMAPDGKFCMFKKNSKKWSKGLVHPNYDLVGKKGPQFENTIVHKMSNNISDLVRRFNRNTTLYSEELRLEDEKRGISFRKVISRFIKSFFKRKGYKHGKLGLLIGILNAIYPLVSLIKSKEN